VSNKKTENTDDGCVELNAPEGATDLSIGGANYAVKGGRVRVPRELAGMAYQFGYTNVPVPNDEVEAEADRVRAAQAEMDKVNAVSVDADPIADFLNRDAADVIAELGALSDDELGQVASEEAAHSARETVVAAIADEQAKRASA
jgi:hypothetical protein